MFNAYDNYLIEKVLPAIKKALHKEDKLFSKHYETSKEKHFYREDYKGIASYVLTERTLQYIIFRELCKSFKIIPERLAYKKTNERLDFAIFKNITDYENKDAEIGVELKCVAYTQKGGLYKSSLNGLIGDFDKIKNIENKNKYILTFGLYYHYKIDIDEFNDYLYEVVDNKKKKKFDITAIAQTSFKTNDSNGKGYYLIVLFKVY